MLCPVGFRIREKRVSQLAGVYKYQLSHVPAEKQQHTQKAEEPALRRTVTGAGRSEPLHGTPEQHLLCSVPTPPCLPATPPPATPLSPVADFPVLSFFGGSSSSASPLHVCFSALYSPHPSRLVFSNASSVTGSLFLFFPTHTFFLGWL